MATKLERVAALAMNLGQRHLADYGATRSRHDFTQRQLMACLILRAYLKTTYRGLLDILAGHGRLRTALGLEGKLPHFTTLQKFSSRSEVLEIADALIGQIGKWALRAQVSTGKKVAVAMDATGMETSVASAHFASRAGRTRRRWVKLSLAVVCGNLFPLGLVMDWGPSNDKCQAFALLEKSFEEPVPGRRPRLYADAGYDADWIHELCRGEWGVESIIKPARHKSDGSLGGTWRAAMTKEHLRKCAYGRRWQIESFISGLKRTTGSALAARTDTNLLKEAAIRVLAYALNR
jgi:hypothetical protein